MFEELDTPRLILDRGRLQENAYAFLLRADQLGVRLRPHLKTSKCLEVGAIAKGGDLSGITVSTLKEAHYFAEGGYSDILYSTSVTPNKFARVRAIYEATGERVLLVADSIDVARAAVTFTDAHNCALDFLIEIDCGEHRSGLLPESEEVAAIARVLNEAAHTHFKGVMTHAGHSYGAADIAEVVRIAEDERRAVVDTAAMLAGEGIHCEIVSVGSSPTFMHAVSLAGVTEARAGIYLFWDLFQMGRGVCSIENVALSVLATVIGHNRAEGTILIDAGGLALSKDIGAGRFLSDAGYGYVCDLETLTRHGNLSVNVVHQEHGAINVDDAGWYDRLPVGSMVRIIPNHACMTAAAYDQYLVIEDGAPIATWPRISGW